MTVAPSLASTGLASLAEYALYDGLCRAASLTSAFFLANPNAYESTLDHVLIHNAEQTLSPYRSRIYPDKSYYNYAIRFVGGKAQVRVPGARKGSEVADIALVVNNAARRAGPKLILLQSKRLFPSSGRALKAGASPIPDLLLFLSREFSTRAEFYVGSKYQGLADKAQWTRISTVNAAARGLGASCDLINYLFYNPPHYEDVKTLLPSNDMLGIRVVSHAGVRSSFRTSPPHAVGPRMFPEFRLPDSEFARFILNAIACVVGVPINGLGTSQIRRTFRRADGKTIQRTVSAYDLGMQPSDVWLKAQRSQQLSFEFDADASDGRPVLDLSNCMAMSVATGFADDNERRISPSDTINGWSDKH